MPIKKDKAFNKNLFFSICSLPIKTVRLNRQGFTVIGVLVASVIGLIVVTGVGQLFVNMSSQLKQMEYDAKRVFFSEFIGSKLQTGCVKTLEDYNTSTPGIINGVSTLQFKQLKDDNGRTILDLGIEKDRLESEYGVTGNTYFQLKCVGYLHDHDSDPLTPMVLNNDCDCSASTTSCGRTWTLSLISQRKISGAFVYNKNFSFELDISYPDAVGDPNNFSCNVTAISGGGSNACVHVENNLSLVGCGTTAKDATATNNANKTTSYGFNAGPNIGTGKHNTFIGYSTGTNTTGEQNTFLGYMAGQANTTGNYNTFIGTEAGTANTASNNTFLGYLAGNKNTTGTGNTFLGNEAGKENLTGNNNTFVGDKAGLVNTVSDNTFIGYQAGDKNTTGTGNTFLGNEAGGENVTGNNNTFVGDKAGTVNTVNDNTFVGYQAGDKNTTGMGNTFLGNEAGGENVTGNNNTFLGDKAGLANTASDNTFVGYQAGTANTTGKSNIFIGGNAGQSNTTGKENVFIGHQAGENSTGDANFFLGTNAGRATTSGENNVFLGTGTGSSNTTGDHNLFLGRSAGRDRTTGSQNVIVGSFAAAKSSGGNNNVFIGRSAGRTNSGERNVFIGHSSGDNSAYSSVDDHFIVGNNSNRDWIVGDIGQDTITINGKQICLDGGPTCATPSSRTVKKNIKPFKNFKKALKDLLKTPLFTYEYKKDHPEKSRMGIISEELPEHLQIKEKGKVSKPDWPSIYGSFWAGSKPCMKCLESLNKNCLLKF